MNDFTLPSGRPVKLYTPMELEEYLDNYVIGQKEAKHTLITAVYNHYKRIYASKVKKTYKSNEKSNVLLTGPTGCGKTYMVRLLAEHMGIPYFIGDATTITQAGFVGDDPETLLAGLLRSCNWSVSDAECGIIFIDEIDKIAKRHSGPNLSGKDPVGEGVQQALLKIIEGNKVGVMRHSDRKRPDEDLVYINTNDILFIGSGSFAGIEPIIMERLQYSQVDYSKIMKYLCPSDICKFGFIPEFVGRFPVITNVNPLTKDDYVKIITNSESSLMSYYKMIFEMDNMEVMFADETINYIASLAAKFNMGVRSLRSVFEWILEDYMFYAPISAVEKLTIDKEMAMKKLNKRFDKIEDVF